MQRLFLSGILPVLLAVSSTQCILQQTCQVLMLRMSEKFVDPPKNVSSVARKIFLGAF